MGIALLMGISLLLVVPFVQVPLLKRLRRLPDGLSARWYVLPAVGHKCLSGKWCPLGD